MFHLLIKLNVFKTINVVGHQYTSPIFPTKVLNSK